MITQKAKYALRALIALAREPDARQPVGVPRLSQEQRIPKKFLEQILLELKQAGILESRRGKAGGYLFLRPAREVTFGDVLRLVDGPVAPLPCLSVTAYARCEDCVSEQDCEIHQVLGRVAQATRAVLDSTTLADAVRKPNRLIRELAAV